MSEHRIKYGSSTIEYLLEHTDRKTLGIRVHPDNTVQVLAPLDASLEKVSEKVKKKAAWILKQQDFFLSFHPLTPPRKYVSGETHMYLGKQFRLKLHTGKPSVKLAGGFIHITTPNTDNKDKIKSQLNDWYKSKAEKHFNALFRAYYPLMGKLTTKEVELHYRWMKKRWGSCDVKGGIHLNLELIKAPKKCIEYVIVHEICHLAHHNHSRAFYDLLEKEFPKWRETKNRLERVMV